MRIFGPLVCSTTSPVTETLASLSASVVSSAPSTTRTGCQRDGGAGLTLELLDLHEVTDRDLVLLSAGLDDRVRCHRTATLFPVQLRRTVRAGVPREWSGGCCLRPLAGPGTESRWAHAERYRRAATDQDYGTAAARVKPAHLPAAPHHASTSTGGPAGRPDARRRRDRGGTITGAVRNAVATSLGPPSLDTSSAAMTNTVPLESPSGAAAARETRRRPGRRGAAGSVSTGAVASATGSVVSASEPRCAARPLWPRRRLQPRPGPPRRCRPTRPLQPRPLQPRPRRIRPAPLRQHRRPPRPPQRLGLRPSSPRRRAADDRWRDGPPSRARRDADAAWRHPPRAHAARGRSGRCRSRRPDYGRDRGVGVHRTRRRHPRRFARGSHRRRRTTRRPGRSAR